MKGSTHGAIVAGVSSTFVAGYIRESVQEAYEPNVEPPPKSKLLHERAPLAFAGLGFTGLSTAVAYEFDSLEKQILGETKSNIPLQQQGGVHRNLHSLPYIGAVWGAARLILHSTERFGEWVASKLQVQDLAPQIVERLQELAEWIVDGSCFGVLGHILGDLPTKGQGGTALRLFAPITDQNFSLKWFKSKAPSANLYFTKAGILLAGASWVVGGVYLLSWKPPEKHVHEYISKVKECDDFSEAVETIRADLSSNISDLIDGAAEQFWNRPLFDSSFKEIHPSLEYHWFHQHIDPETVFGINSYKPSILVEKGIWTEDLQKVVEGASLKSNDGPKGIALQERPVAETEGSTIIDFVSESDEGLPLIQSEAEEDPSLFSDMNEEATSLSESDNEGGLSLSEDGDMPTGLSLLADNEESEDSLFTDTESESSEISIEEDPDSESSGTE